MLLAVNIGNTNIHTGLFRQGRLIRRHCFSSRGVHFTPGFKKAISGFGVKHAVICSVVPRATGPAVKILTRLLGKKPYLVNKTLRVPLINLYRKPQQLGQDRLVNAYAADCFYRVPAIVIDMGTAITIDAVSARHQYLGGVILPGLRMSQDALRHRTALLPQVALGEPRSIIGRDTTQGLRAGLMYGTAFMIDGFIREMKALIGSRACVIATGGDSLRMRTFCKSRFIIDLDLTLKGLYSSYQTLHE